MLTTDRKGAIAELAIALAATKAGIEVYRPMSEGGRYDLIFDIGRLVSAVQVGWSGTATSSASACTPLGVRASASFGGCTRQPR
jgi:PD-(D/E)XK endonuclease